MFATRSIPKCTVIPELAYPNIGEAIDWLCNAFGFTLRIRIADHRAQLNVSDGAVVLTEQRVPGGNESHAVMVRVEDVDRHYERARKHGDRILRSPSNFPYGELQYNVTELVGHV